MKWSYIYLFDLVFLSYLNTYPEEELLDHMVVLFLSSEKLPSFFHSGCTNLHPHQQGTRFHFFLYPCQYLWFIVFLIIAILTDVRWCLIVVLVHISLVISDVNFFPCAYWPSMYLLWKNFDSNPLSIFKLDLFLLLAIEPHEFFV